MTSVVSRREFLGGMVAATGAVGTPRHAVADADETKPVSQLIASAPVLQNAAERSMGVAFAVSADASGWVEISKSPDMSGAKRVYSGGLGMMEVNDKIAQILVRGLKPATRYWYRIGADRIAYRDGYRMKNLGREVDGKVHSFTTLGAEAKGSFCIINDTHDQKPAIDSVFSKVAELKPSVVIWNGDVLRDGHALHVPERQPRLPRAICSASGASVDVPRPCGAQRTLCGTWAQLRATAR